MAIMPCWLRQSVRSGSRRNALSSVRVMPCGTLRVDQPVVRRLVFVPPRLAALRSLDGIASSVRNDTLVPALIIWVERVTLVHVWLAAFQV